MKDVRAENESLLRAYSIVFGSPEAKPVLEDLGAFCRATDTCFNADPRIHAALEGRREVYLRIQKFSGLTEEQILQMAARRMARLTSEDEDD